MANEEQLEILKKGVNVWNEWREQNPKIAVDLRSADLQRLNLGGAKLWGANLRGTNLFGCNLNRASFILADLRGADLREVSLSGAWLDEANLRGASLLSSDLRDATFRRSNFMNAAVGGGTIFGNLDLSEANGLDHVVHLGPSTISTDTFARSKGKIPKVFLEGCGLNDWEIEETKLYNPDLSNEEIDKTLYRIHDLRASHALQISPLFISYSHADSEFVDKVGDCFAEKGVRYWRDIHEMKAGRIETQIDRGIRQNPTVLLILSEHSLNSDWVEHEVRTGRELEKELSRDVLCPVALDNSWKDSRWPKRVMEQIMEYNILDFSDWQDNSKFDCTFSKLIDGLELFYKG
jgi:hypothetical protein